MYSAVSKMRKILEIFGKHCFPIYIIEYAQKKVKVI